MASSNKTQPTQRSVEQFLEMVTPATKQVDSSVLCEIMSRVSGEQPTLWGPSIVGFGVTHYRYESGREGTTPRIAFSPRKEALVLYGMSVQDNPLLAKLGKFTTGKGCLYIKRLSEVDASVLELIIERAWARGDKNTA